MTEGTPAVAPPAADAPAADAPVVPSEPTFSLAEVAKHMSKADAWIVIDGKVFDVTEFLEDHPGGPEIMFEHVGERWPEP